MHRSKRGDLLEMDGKREGARGERLDLSLAERGRERKRERDRERARREMEVE